MSLSAEVDDPGFWRARRFPLTIDLLFACGCSTIFFSSFFAGGGFANGSFPAFSAALNDISSVDSKPKASVFTDREFIFPVHKLLLILQ